MDNTQPTILFVDDAADTRALVEWNLRQEGFAVATAQTADECLTLARQNVYALLLLDIGLPDKDGLELCAEIRRFDQETPILFFTAFADLLDHDKAREAGAQGCLRKPEDMARLGAVIKQLLE